MGNRVIRVSEAEAAGNLASLLEQVRAGAEVVIEQNAQPVAVVRAIEPVRRTISDCIALAELHARECGHEPTLDAEFAADRWSR